MYDWQFFAELRHLITRDPAGRGLDRIPGRSLVSHTAADLQAACTSLAVSKRLEVAIVTGFYVARAECYETDGPLGAIFLADILHQLGAGVTILSEAGCCSVLEIALRLNGLEDHIRLSELPSPDDPETNSWMQSFWQRNPHITHLISIERAGPSHSLSSLIQQSFDQPAPIGQFAREVDPGCWNRPYSMRGYELAAFTSPVHRLFEVHPAHVHTIGVGDGGNEIGMGRIPWLIIRDNIDGGSKIACRIPTQALIVSGTSNWGAYALAAGTAWLKHRHDLAATFDASREAQLWEATLAKEPLVDGITASCQLTVDGLEWNEYRTVMDHLSLMLQRERSATHGIQRLSSLHG